MLPMRRAAAGAAALAGLLWGLTLAADVPTGVAAERQRLQAEEQAVRATFAAEEATCRERFFVTSCIDDARRHERAALAALRKQTLAIDEAERQRRAALRNEAVALKQAAAASAVDAAPPADAAPVPTTLPNPGAVEATPPAVTTLPPSVASPPLTPLPPLPPPRAPGPDADAEREAAGRALASEQRRQAAVKEQARIAEREAQRQSSSKASPPLPVRASAASR
jgi:colicin import membrane protein